MANEQASQFVVGIHNSKEVTICGVKTIAVVKLLGGAIRLAIPDSVEYEIPTEEQRENLKKVFGIDIEVLEDGK